MSVTDLAPTSSRRTAQQTAEILDQVLGQVREALARASVVPDPTDAARELRALGSAAWEGAERIQPFVAEHILDIADLVDAAAERGESAASAPSCDLSDEMPVIGYRPRHSSSRLTEASWLTSGQHEPAPLTAPRWQDASAPPLARPAAGAGANPPAQTSTPGPTGGTIADRLAALDALLSTSERFLTDARPTLITV